MPMELATKPQADRFPRTRYQGSKRKLLAPILAALDDLDFNTVLDGFGGTSVISHALKKQKKRVTYNDILRFNHQIGLALVENDKVRLSNQAIENVIHAAERFGGEGFIARTFEGIYFTTAENRWLDGAVRAIGAIDCRYERALAWYALFQAALAKRPYNLFHRANLYMRTARVSRTFGNKATWDRSFPEHFQHNAEEVNNAVIDGEEPCSATCRDLCKVSGTFDVVYLDPPYINARGVAVDYHHFYHFLEGMVRYDEWPDLIDPRSKHRRLRREVNPWCDAVHSCDQFARAFDRFRESTLVVSYRSDGIPKIEKLVKLLQNFKTRVHVRELSPYQYALSTNRESHEVLLIGD